MNEGKRMAELYRSVYEGDAKGEAWHGYALRPLLRSITADEASRKAEIGRHSILQLVLHIAYWEEIDLRRFNGEMVDAPLNSPEDWPENRKINNAEWEAALARLEKSHAAFREAIADCSDERLTKRVPGKDYDNYLLLHGTLDHAVYHTAQIVLLKENIRLVCKRVVSNP